MTDAPRFSKASPARLIQPEVVDCAAAMMAPEEDLYDVAELFKALADTTRTRILWALCDHELCVNDLSVLLNMTMTAVSHQLRVLKQARLLASRREGRVVYYRLNDGHVRTLLTTAMEHVCEGGRHHHEA